MRVGFFGLDEEEKKKYFEDNLSSDNLTFFPEALDPENLPEQKDFDAISVFVRCLVDKKVIESFPNLKMIAVRSTGFDNVDLEAARSKNISVCNVPDYGSHTVAEFTFGLMLSLLRNIPQAVRKVKEDGQYNFEGLRGVDLNGKTLGVVGTGKIGRNVIKTAKAFGMEVLAFDVKPDDDLAWELKFKYVPLDDLLQGSDIITLHVPYFKETHHLINSQNIEKIKNGAYLINTARGAIIETESLVAALKSQKISGAALDVLEEEGELKEEAELLLRGKLSQEEMKSILENHVLIDLPNVLITPHMAFYTKEAEFSILKTTVQNLKGFSEKNPQNLVS